MKQMWQVFQMTRRYDPSAQWLMLLGFSPRARRPRPRALARRGQRLHDRAVDRRRRARGPADRARHPRPTRSAPPTRRSRASPARSARCCAAACAAAGSATRCRSPSTARRRTRSTAPSAAAASCSSARARSPHEAHARRRAAQGRPHPAERAGHADLRRPRRGLGRASASPRDAAQDQAHAHQARGARGVEPPQLAPDALPIPKGIDPMKARGRSAARCADCTHDPRCGIRCPTDAASASQARISTVPATLSWKPRWSESQTSAGTTTMSSSVRTSGRQRPTQPLRRGRACPPVADAAADRDEHDLHEREDREGQPRVQQRAVRGEEQCDQERDAQSIAIAPMRRPTRPTDPGPESGRPSRSPGHRLGSRSPKVRGVASGIRRVLPTRAARNMAETFASRSGNRGSIASLRLSHVRPPHPPLEIPSHVQ